MAAFFATPLGVLILLVLEALAILVPLLIGVDPTPQGAECRWLVRAFAGFCRCWQNADEGDHHPGGR
jgi:hypothetical protein